MDASLTFLTPYFLHNILIAIISLLYLFRDKETVGGGKATKTVPKIYEQTDALIKIPWLIEISAKME